MKSLSILTALFASMAAVIASPLAQASNSIAATPTSSQAAASSAASGSAEPTETGLNISPFIAGSHNGSTLALPISLDWDSEVLESGWNPPLAVKGWTHLTLRSDGSYTFSGHYEATGTLTTPWYIRTGWTIKAKNGAVYRFLYPEFSSSTCKVYSKPGDTLDCNWKVSGFNIDIKNNWENIVNGLGGRTVEAHV